MKSATILFLLSFSFLLHGQSFQLFIDHINSLPDTISKQAVVDSFMNANPELPFIDSEIATFIYQGNEDRVTVIGDFNNWNNNISKLTLLSGTDLWYYSKSFELNARLDYLFFLSDGEEILDPNNPDSVLHRGDSYYSVLVMPEYIWPWEIDVYPDVPKGTLDSFELSDDQLGKTYKIWIYLPPGYDDSDSSGYPTVYFNDGDRYVLENQIIDNLIDSNMIKSVIGVFVKPNDRDEEFYGTYRRFYREFFVNQLVPFVDSAFNTITDPGSRTVIGASGGGNIAILIAYKHDDLFGQVGLQAAYFGNGDESFKLVVNGPKKNIRWASICGTYDFLFSINKTFRDSLIERDYTFCWGEFPEGHSTGLFGATIDNLLICFQDNVTSGTAEQPSRELLDFRVYPNPFNAKTTIKFDLKTSTNVRFKIFNLAGQELVTLFDGFQTKGEHELDWNADGLPGGVYFLCLKTSEGIFTRKCVFQQ